MADSKDEGLTFPCTLDDVRQHWSSGRQKPIARSTFYRWLEEIKREHPGIVWYGKRGRHTRVTAEQYDRLEAAIWDADAAHAYSSRPAPPVHRGYRTSKSDRARKARETRELRDAALSGSEENIVVTMGIVRARRADKLRSTD